MVTVDLRPPKAWGIARIHAEVEDNDWVVLSPDDPRGEIAELLRAVAQVHERHVHYSPDPQARFALAVVEHWEGSSIDWSYLPDVVEGLVY